jgi:hypothetical protein
MEDLTRETGPMESSMVKESMLLHKEQRNMVNGRKGKEADGLEEMMRDNE